MKDKEVTQLVDARAICALAMPTLAYLLFKFDISYSDRIKTASASLSGGKFFILLNRQFWESLTTPEKSFLLFHEVLHVFLHHHERLKTAKYKKIQWNFATDYFINYTLKGFGKNRYDIDSRLPQYITMPTSGLFKSEFIGMSADEIYNVIKDVNLNESDLFDEIGEIGEIGDGDLSEDDEAILRQTISAAVIHGNSMGSSIGTREAGILRIMEEIITPQIDWKSLISTHIDRSSFQRNTYNKYNKRSDRILFPRKIGENVRVLFGVDTSGSMSDNDLTIAMGGIYEILNQFESWELTLVTCDVNAVVIGKYSSENGDNFDVVDKKLIGGGGTDMNPIIQLANELVLDYQIDTCILLTDGYIPKISSVVLCDFLILITPNGKEIFIDNAKTIKINV